MQTFEILLSINLVFWGAFFFMKYKSKKNIEEPKPQPKQDYKLVFIPINEIDKEYQNIIKPEFLRNHLLKDDAKFIEFIKSGNTDDQLSMLEEFEKSEMYIECSIIRDVINGKL